MKYSASNSHPLFAAIFLFLLFMNNTSIGQNSVYIDSVLNVIKTQDEFSQITSYRKLHYKVLKHDVARSKEYLDSARLIAKRTDDLSLIAQTTSDYGAYLDNTAEYEKSIEEYDKAIVILKKLEDGDLLSRTLNNKALTLAKYGQTRKALVVHLQSLKIKEELRQSDSSQDDTYYWDESIAASYTNIGNLHADMQNIDKSNEYYEKGLEIYKKLDLVDDVQMILENKAINYVNQKEYQKAIYTFKNCIDYLKTNNYKTSLAIVYGNLTRAYKEVDSLDQAKATIKKALELKDKHNDISLYGLHKRYEGDLFMIERKFSSALLNYKEAKSIAKETNYKRSIIMGDLRMSEAYAALGQFKRAYESLSLHQEAYKEELGIESKAKINELEILYETERKEKELFIEKEKVNLLEKEAKISALQRWLLGSGLLLALGGVGFVWYSAQLKAKFFLQEKEKLDAELDFKKKELTTHALHLAKKNEFLEGLKSKAESLRTESEEKDGYRQLIRTIDFDLRDDNNWETFANYFQQVHKGFNQTVIQKYPEVTPNELRLISLVKMNLSIKEMANILNISVPGVKKARQRLRKKMNLETKDSLEVAVLEI